MAEWGTALSKSAGAPGFHPGGRSGLKGGMESKGVEGVEARGLGGNREERTRNRKGSPQLLLILTTTLLAHRLGANEPQPSSVWAKGP